MRAKHKKHVRCVAEKKRLFLDAINKSHKRRHYVNPVIFFQEKPSHPEITPAVHTDSSRCEPTFTYLP